VTGAGALRLGVLGCARIAPFAVVGPARLVPDDVVVAAVAARDPARAVRFARRHRIARAHDDYDAVVDDPALDAIYVPLPNTLHRVWAIRALEAGKHVLCEKPLATSGADARAMRDAARRAGRVLMEAFHWRYHPLADALFEAVRALGLLSSVHASFTVPLFVPGDIRYRADLGGGALLDVGCYTVSIGRALAGVAATDDVVVDSARAWRGPGGVDRAFHGVFRATGGPPVEIDCAIASPRLVACRAVARGRTGKVSAWNPVMPQLGHLLWTTSWPRRVPGPATYVGQLRAFVAACRGRQRPALDVEESVAIMDTIDALTAAAAQPGR
jgi:predicted dehydrogenase